jgi:hypothetical protein
MGAASADCNAAADILLTLLLMLDVPEAHEAFDLTEMPEAKEDAPEALDLTDMPEATDS